MNRCENCEFYMPDDNLPALSRWLLWRVDGLALHDIGPEVVVEVTSAVAHCHRLIDRPADRQYLGVCDVCQSGRLYAKAGSMWAELRSAPRTSSCVGTHVESSWRIALSSSATTPAV